MEELLSEVLAELKTLNKHLAEYNANIKAANSQRPNVNIDDILNKVMSTMGGNRHGK